MSEIRWPHRWCGAVFSFLTQSFKADLQPWTSYSANLQSHKNWFEELATSSETPTTYVKMSRHQVLKYNLIRIWNICYLRGCSAKQWHYLLEGSALQIQCGAVMTRSICEIVNPPVTGEFPAEMASNAENFPFDDVIMMDSKVNTDKKSYRKSLQRGILWKDSCCIHIWGFWMQCHVFHCVHW